MYRQVSQKGFGVYGSASSLIISCCQHDFYCCSCYCHSFIVAVIILVILLALMMIVTVFVCFLLIGLLLPLFLSSFLGRRMSQRMVACSGPSRYVGHREDPEPPGAKKPNEKGGFGSPQSLSNLRGSAP